MWGGTVVEAAYPTSFGSAFGRAVVIDHDKLPDGSPGYWGLYAHLSAETVSVGQRVGPGQKIGAVGTTGNSSGNHLHTGIYKQPSWRSCGGINPQPWLDATAADGPYVTADVYRSKCGFGEPTNGDASSDTVKELQERLNRVSLKGGQNLPVTGRYDVETDEEVRLWQDQVCGDPPDPPMASYLGPNQFARMFPDSVYALHDDGNPAIASGITPPPPDPGDGEDTTLGQWLRARGWVVHDDGVPLGRESAWRGVEYLMVHHTGSPGNDTSDPAEMAEYIRHAEADKHPPLAQLLLDQGGEVWVCCREREGQAVPGRASHAGSGGGYGIPDDSMNERCLGVEHMADGTKPLRSYPILYDASTRLFADLRSYFGLGADRVIGHKEWSDTGKVDPLDDMDVVRADVEAVVNPPVPPDIPDEETTINALGLYKWYSGKDTAAVKIYPDNEWHPICKRMKPSGIKEESSETHFLYLRIELPAGRTASRNIETRWVRSDGDATAYKGPEFTPGSKDSIPYENCHIEEGSGLGGQWQIQVHGGKDPIVVTTRYAKTHIVYVDPVVVAVAASMDAL